MKEFKTDILILGAGIGGYEAFRALSKEIKKNKLNKKITIIDQNNYFTFTPLLHEVASGSIEPRQAAIPLRELIQDTNHDFLKAKVIKVMPEQKKVLTDKAEIGYEYCILSLGSGVNFYNTTGASENCYTVRTMHEALKLRSAIIKKLDDCDNDLNINIIGGGYTGVEVAGQLSHLSSYDLKRLYPKASIKVRLIQASDSLVPQLPQKAREKILQRLKKMGVEIFFNTKVNAVEKEKVILSDSEIPNDIAVWSAGVDNIASNFIEEHFCERGQIVVNEFLQHQQFDNLYGAGDIICGHNISESNKFPQIGEAAFHEGTYIARHIAARIMKKPLPAAFNFKSRGMLMPIGENYGIAIFGDLVIDGFFAWWLRRTVYLMFIPGYLRKIKLIINWTLNLFGFRYVVDIE